MGFETVALSVISKTVSNAQPEFTSGTLFVKNVDAVEAHRILVVLRHYLQCAVQMSEVGVEYAYDFI